VDSVVYFNAQQSDRQSRINGGDVSLKSKQHQNGVLLDL